jgi:hypothetical protein
MAPTDGDSKNEAGQLIEGVDDLETNQRERRDHQIIAEMHERLETKCCSGSARDPEPGSDTLKKDECPANSSAIETEGFRRRGSDAIVANLFLTRGLLFDASSLLFTRRRKS